MNRFIIYDPECDSYVDIGHRGWTSGHMAHDVNSYNSLEKAQEAVRLFQSLENCQITEIVNRVDIVKNWGLV